jgi:magnesium chelatase family protein
MQRRRYFGKLSKPLIDRIDLQLRLNRLSLADMAGATEQEASRTVAARVRGARRAQRERLGRWGHELNSEVSAELLKTELRLSRTATVDLDLAMERDVLTGRGYARVLRVAWTMADLAGLAVPDRDCVSTALAFRQQVGAA